MERNHRLDRAHPEISLKNGRKKAWQISTTSIKSRSLRDPCKAGPGRARRSGLRFGFRHGGLRRIRASPYARNVAHELKRISTRIASIAESATLKVDGKAKALQAAGRPVISFAAGEPDFQTPEH